MVEVSPEQLLQILRAGQAPEKLRHALAKAVVPLPPPVLLESLDILADDPDGTVRAEALESLARVPPTVVRGVVASSGTPPALLDRLVRRFPGDETLAQQAARNPSAADDTIVAVAGLPFASVLELVGRNQTRLDRDPRIAAALRDNPATPVHIRDLLPPPPAAAGADAEGEIVPDDSNLPAVLIEEETGGAAEPGEPAGHDEARKAKQASVYQLLKTLSMGQKVALAVKGNKEVRAMLIRESNRLVSLKVLENPRLTDGDVESFAKNTSLSKDVLRGIAAKKEWLKKYGIVKGIVFNPNTPLGVSMDLLKRISARDMEFLMKNRNVPETLRTTARKILSQKDKKPAGGGGGH